MKVVNTPAYYDWAIITAVKSFIVIAPVSKVDKPPKVIGASIRRQ
jgi:hypothetical protein